MQAKLSSKSQIVVPAALRRQLGIKPGDVLEISCEGDQIILRKAAGSYVDALAELASTDVWAGCAEELAEARSEWDR